MKHLFTAFAVAAVAMSASAYDFSYTVDPVEGEVDMLQTVTLTFPNVEEVEILSKEDLFVTRNGRRVHDVNVKWKYPNKIQFAFDTEQTEPATYNVYIPGSTVCGFADLTDDGYQWVNVNEQDIMLTYEIKGSESGSFDWSYMVMPEEGVVNEIREIQVYFPEIEEMDINSKSDIVLSHNGIPVDGVAVSIAANLLSIEPSDVLKEAGEYTLTLPDGVFTAYGNDNGDGYQNFGLNPETITLTWSIEGELPPVEADLTLGIATPKPNAAGEISADKSLESIFLFCDQAGMAVAPGTEANVTIEEVNGDFKASTRLQKGRGLNSAYSYFIAAFGTEPSYNGEYIITIAEGAFGDAEWLANPATGHTNAELKISFTLIDGADHDIYTIQPVSVTPESGTYSNASDIATFTVKYEDGVTPVEDAKATLAGMGTVVYGETVSFTKTEDGSYTATFDPAPVEDGEYVLIVKSGMFTDGTLFSAPIELNYTISYTDGVATVISTGEQKIYDLNGNVMDCAVEALPAGIYVINGRKVIVK
ncbi:MAG: hypothetical protein K2L35_04315 [Muribaculaceae bacterium]|nr:hypothetical protein [Muribaculaceae bacterium]